MKKKKKKKTDINGANILNTFSSDVVLIFFNFSISRFWSFNIKYQNPTLIAFLKQNLFTIQSKRWDVLIFRYSEGQSSRYWKKKFQI